MPALRQPKRLDRHAGRGAGQGAPHGRRSEFGPEQLSPNWKCDRRRRTICHSGSGRGVIAHRDAATGANVSAGRVLFRVVDAAQVHVVGQVSESEAARARLTHSAEIEIAGQPDRIPTGRW